MIGFRFDWLMPNLEPDYAVDRIMDATLTNSYQLIMPRLLMVLMALKWSVMVFTF